MYICSPTFEGFENMKKVDGYLKQFVIQFSGLKLGLHEFEFEIGNLFFERFNIEDVTTGNLKVDFSLEKKENSMLFEFSYNGTISTFCDRCLESLEIPVLDNNEIHIKFADETSYENDELIVLGSHEYQIDIAPILYEFISLGIPLRKVHEEKDCNQEVINRLAIADSEAPTDEEDAPSVWDTLKKLK